MTYPGALSNPILARIGVSLIGSPLTQTFITLDPAQQGHFALQNPVVETGDFEWSLDFQGLSNINATLVSGDDFKFQVESSGVIVFSFRDTSEVRQNLTYSTLIVTDPSAFNSVSLEGVGDSYTATLNGVSATIVKPDRKPLASTRLGINVSGLGDPDFFDGILANIDLGNGNAWPLDVLTGNTQQAVNGNNVITLVNIPEGAPDRELFTKNTSTDPDQWENADKSRIIQVA